MSINGLAAVTKRKRLTVRTLCKILPSLVVVFLLLSADSAIASIAIDTVTVGNAFNDADVTGYGSVGYDYDIGKYEVTASQYTAFLNAVAAVDTYGLYNSGMWTTLQGCKIQQSGSLGSYTYSVASDYADRPVNFVSWGDAARFANWMANGQPTGAEDLSTTEDGSYYLNGANTSAALMAVTRKPNATWVIPTENEWYKAAYHKNDGATANYWTYPTQVNSPAPGRDLTETTNPGNNANYYGNGVPYPIDGACYTTKVGQFNLSDSAYGTFDQGGNVYEWDEGISGSTRIVRGAGWGSSNPTSMSSAVNYSSDPLTDRSDFGFRLADLIPPAPVSTWKVGTPIVTFWGGHDLTDVIAQRDVDGGYNLDWAASWTEVATAGQYGLRTRLRSDWYLGNLLWPSSLDGGTKQAQLNALIDRYKTTPAPTLTTLRTSPIPRPRLTNGSR